MEDEENTKEQLINGLAEMRQRIAELESAETARKRTEKALRESEVKYRSLFENMFNGFAYCQILLDGNNHPVDFVYLEVNDALERLTGLKKQDVVRKKVTEVIPSIKDTHPELFDIYGEVALTGKETRFDLHFKPLDIWLSISVYSPQKGYFVAVFENITERKKAEEELKKHREYLEGLVEQRTVELTKANKQLRQEITERKQAEEALRESEERFRSIVENTDAGYFFIDKDGLIQDVNDSWIKIYKYSSADEILGKHFTIIQKADDVEKAKEFVDGIMRGDTRYLAGEFSRKNKDGTIGYHTFSARPVSRFGEVIGIEGFIINTTDRRRVEEALKASEQNLQDLIYIASHDLQTPIVSMVGYANNILKKYSQGMDEKGVYAVQRLKANAERLHQLVLSLLDLSRLNTIKNPYQTFDPEEVVKHIIEELSLKLKESGTEIVIQALPAMYGDKPRLASVFRNLLTNALNYGGKHIVAGYQDGAYFVRDDGIGIAARNLEKIFRSGDRLKKVDVEGVGMGLTFCQKVITQYKGKIWAESEGEGKGSTFYFTIPTKKTTTN